MTDPFQGNRTVLEFYHKDQESEQYVAVARGDFVEDKAFGERTFAGGARGSDGESPEAISVIDDPGFEQDCFLS